MKNDITTGIGIKFFWRVPFLDKLGSDNLYGKGFGAAW